ncbi:hypothetical protein EDD21DRAFT_447073 [Dissophora ornata]|nr:hypothetical protein EDD21DRAFT_447073 [Dissophora ornata]
MGTGTVTPRSERRTLLGNENGCRHKETVRPPAAPGHSHSGSDVDFHTADENGDEDEDLVEEQRGLLSRHSSSSFSNNGSSARHPYQQPTTTTTTTTTIQMSSSSPISTPPPSYMAEPPMQYPLPASQHPLTGGPSSPNEVTSTPLLLLGLNSPTATTADPYGSTSKFIPNDHDHDHDHDQNHDNHVAVTISDQTPLPRVDTTNMDIDERRCRICLETDDDETHPKSDKLISPCLCKGSSRYIHLGCLEKWRTMSTRKESFYSCDTCHYHYSFSRPWIAGVLGHRWFLHIITVVMFLVLFYGAARTGRALNARGIWKWKQKYVADPDKPMRTVLGLDWMDLLWGLVVVAVMGLIFLIVKGCTMLFDHRGSRGGSSDGGCGGCGSCIYMDCGGSGEGMLVASAVIAFLAGTFGAFVGIYWAMSIVNKAVLNSMQETILEVK